MWYDMHAENLLLARDMMNMILMTCQDNTAVRIRDYAQTNLQHANTISYFTRVGNVMDQVLIGFDQANVCLLGPARNAIHIQNCVRGYTNDNTNSLPHSCNEGLWQVANTARAVLESTSMWSQKPLFIAGHSYGGGVAYALARMRRLDEPNLRTVMQTFGAPKCMLASEHVFFQRPDNWSWMCERDPVPHLLPTRQQSPALHSQLSVASSHLVDLYGWPTGYTIVKDDGTLLNAGEPPLYGLPASVALVEWFSGIQGMLHPAHTAIHYVERLNDAVALNGNLSYPRAIVQPVVTTPTQVAVVGEPSVAQPLVGILDGQEITSLSPQTPTGSANPTFSRGGSGFAVVVNGIQVGIAPTRRFARKVEIRAEGLSRQVNNLVSWDGAALAAAILNG